jgi:hypothetical protein
LFMVRFLTLGSEKSFLVRRPWARWAENHTTFARNSNRVGIIQD